MLTCLILLSLLHLVYGQIVQLPLEKVNEVQSPGSQPPAPPQLGNVLNQALDQASQIQGQRRNDEQQKLGQGKNPMNQAAAGLASYLKANPFSLSIGDQGDLMRIAYNLFLNGTYKLPPGILTGSQILSNDDGRHALANALNSAYYGNGGDSQGNTNGNTSCNNPPPPPPRPPKGGRRPPPPPAPPACPTVSLVPAVCTPQLACNVTSKFRTTTGWCNNLLAPKTANTFSELRRVLRPAYQDGIGLPRSKSITGADLPSPRAVSNMVHSNRNISDPTYTHMLMQFGQFMDHDIINTPQADANGAALDCSDCSSNSVSSNCYPIPIPANDPFFPPTTNGKPNCLSFTRSLDGSLQFGVRNQINQNTPFLDGSVIYGSNDCAAAQLRKNISGLMNFTNLTPQNPMALPQGNQETSCQSLPSYPCFVAGDARNNLHPGLQPMQTVFLREHNRIATALAKLQPSWNDERLYQEARRLVGAQFQHIAYNEVLPRYLGPQYMNAFDLYPKKTGYYKGYLSNCDASIMQPFGTAAYRFGHSMIRQTLPRLNVQGNPITNDLDLGLNFLYADSIYNETAGGVNSLTEGLIGSASMAVDRWVADSVRNQLLSIRGSPTSGSDLISRNIMRARDHGVQPYHAWRHYCGMSRVETFNDLANEMSPDTIAALKSVYASVKDIDLFTAVISEKHVQGGLVGPTGACIIGEQFQRLKRCDRFFYESNNVNVLFTPAQLDSIRGITFSKLICQNMPSVTNIQPKAFDQPSSTNPIQTACTSLASIDLSLFV